MIINIMLISNSDDFSAQINADPNVFDLSNDYSADSESFNHDVSDAIDNNYIANISKNENYSDHFMIYMNLIIRTIVYINNEFYNYICNFDYFKNKTENNKSSYFKYDR